ncbi:hypothetical protein FSC37_02740 [Piscinibacter aquaticus]|uniref:Protein kinase domain-containing protein n=1 Tax=Piscinibacter aquaticus TaxID=392597 RepID=A0A5C6U0Q4_9BURK|nr:hypothetical protein FSC37_02740 [Piscinibacter aquaticus]
MQLPWVEAQPLADDIGRCGAPVDPADVRGWLRAIGGALGQLHRGGVVHGGVSPRRVLRLPGGGVLLDLPESARWALAPWRPELVDVDDPSLAPEQWLEPAVRARAIGPWTDVYGPGHDGPPRDCRQPAAAGTAARSLPVAPVAGELCRRALGCCDAAGDRPRARPTPLRGPAAWTTSWPRWA